MKHSPDELGTPQERVRQLVQEQRIKLPAAEREQAPIIVRKVMKAYGQRIRRNRGMAMVLIELGLGDAVRGMIKGKGASRGAALEQLALFPNGQRTLVEAINEEAVFVPSVNRYVKVTPNELTASRADEA